MRAVAQALKTWVGSYGLPAYTVESIPEDVNVPYLTYPLTEPEWNQQASFYIQGWFRSTSNEQLSSVADEIISDIGVGKTMKTASGYLVIYPETPLVQMLVDGDYRSFYISLIIQAYQLPGAFPVQNKPGDSPEEGEN